MKLCVLVFYLFVASFVSGSKLQKTCIMTDNSKFIIVLSSSFSQRLAEVKDGRTVAKEIQHEANTYTLHWSYSSAPT